MFGLTSIASAGGSLNDLDSRLFSHWLDSSLSIDTALFVPLVVACRGEFGVELCAEAFEGFAVFGAKRDLLNPAVARNAPAFSTRFFDGATTGCGASVG